MMRQASSARVLPDSNASPFVRESLLEERVGEKIRCNICERRCLLRPGALGWCRTRQNREGRILNLAYGAVSSIEANPIEKKPFFHFHPGTTALTVGGWSCNFGCPWCQNWHISKSPPPATASYTSPSRFVQLVRESGCQGTSISFNEPTLSLEWSLDVFRETRERGFYNTYVTNGYMTAEALSLLSEAGLDAMNVDVKGDAESVWKFCKAIDVEKVWAACRFARSRGVHLEITTLVIPTVNDSDSTLRGIADRIRSDLGQDVPWHVSAYYPAYRFTVPATPVRTLQQAYEIGTQAGLQFIYVGNVFGHRCENTICPGCGRTLIRRRGFDVLENALGGDQCPGCGLQIPGVWHSS